jgi:hypothetical protein
VEKTRLQNLVRHKSDGDYAPLCLHGKEIWRSVMTAHFSAAEARLPVALKAHRERKSREVKPSNPKMTFGQTAEVHMLRSGDYVSFKVRRIRSKTRLSELGFWPSQASAKPMRAPKAGSSRAATQSPIALLA